MNDNPVRTACQEFSDLADSGGVPESTPQHKILWIDKDQQITGVLGAEGADSLRQGQIGGFNPVRSENGESCQDYLGDGGSSAPQKPILTGQNSLRTLKENPVRREVAR